ncbi:MAG: endonuclease NucS [Methylococcales bacterium]|nr:endonuclease NucS [Methylococcales bacterium]
MTTKNAYDFFSGFTAQELKQLGILRGGTNVLKNTSVDPLLALMKESQITRLEDKQLDWFLDVEGNFKNPKSHGSKEGNYLQLTNPIGYVFDYVNTTINPHYLGNQLELPNTLENSLEEEAEEIIFGLERDLQMALRRNIEQLEDGLKIIDAGKERTVEGGRIDITAEDKEQRLVAIELKAGEAKPESIAQILAYMASLWKEEGKSVRGILVASSFHPRVTLAAQSVPNLELREYSFSFTFKKL